MRRSPRLFAAAGIVVAGMTVAGCISRPAETEQSRTLLPMEAISVDASSAQVLPKRVDDDGIHSILALSAGGADGAYGAGVLKGWTESGARPVFDVVTGVSTGALMAVLAFLGPEFDGELERFYTTQTNDSVFIKAASAAALYDNAPLKKQIEEFITDDIMGRIADEYDKGRRLYVATTNLDAGELVIWDMGEIAKGGRTDSRQHFQKVLRASAAVPAYFAPVYIKPQRGLQLRQAHVDGGVKSPILVSSFMFPTGKVPKQLFMVVNGNTTRDNAVKPVKGDLADIAKKSIMELMRGLQAETVYRDYAIARNAGAEFRLTAIPDNIPPAQESLNFDKKRMRQLYEAGLADGRKSPKAWPTTPPHLTQLEKLASN